MRILLIALLLAGLSACSYLTPYKLDVPQGNAITADQVDKLKLGMSRSQVRFALGAPMLADAFHPSRWDYIYYESTGGKVSENKRYYVQFEGDRLIGMGGETLPARTVFSGKVPVNPREQVK